MTDIWQGIAIGGAGGAIAGLMVYLVQHCHNRYKDRVDGQRILEWLTTHTADKDGERYRSTRAIASWCNLTEDRVRYVCSRHPGIYLSTGGTEDLWSIFIGTRKDRPLKHTANDES